MGKSPARTLAAISNNFTVTPLKTRKDFEDFYVPRVTPSIERLKERIENVEKNGKYLFMGFRGCGKTTELYRLMNLLDKNKFIPFFFDVGILDMNDFDYREFFAAFALYFYENAKSFAKIEKKIEEDFKTFMKDVTKVEEHEEGSEGGIGLSFEKFIVAKLGSERKTRTIVRRNLGTRITDLLFRLNNIIVNVENNVAKRVVIIIDGLDKLSRSKQAERFFYDNYRLLTQIQCHVIYTFPIDLAYSPRFEVVRHEFDAASILPQPPVKTRNLENVYEKGYEFYRKIAEKRMNLDLIDEKALKEAIISTGKLSEFMRTIEGAIIMSLISKKSVVGYEEVLSSLEELRRGYDRTLTREHIERLIEVHDKKDARDQHVGDSVIRDLLFSLTIVEYESEEEGKWQEVNPLLLPLIEKWREEVS